MKFLLGMVTLVATGLAAFSFYEYQDARSEIGVLKQKEQKLTLDLQEKCAKQAEKYVKEYAPNASYENHYNVTLNKCFVDTYELDAGREFVVDVFELKQYAKFAQGVSSSGDGILACEVKSPSASGITSKPAIEDHFKTGQWN